MASSSQALEPGDPREAEQGFIVLVAVVMGGLLALGVYKLFHVTRAVWMREGLTNAADAIALDNAVWHAQGMNLLVWMNIAMAIVLSVFVVLRVLELLLIAVAVVAAIFAPAALTAIGNGLTRVVNLERKVGPRIMRVLHLVNMGERVVAAVVPAIPGVVNRAELVGTLAGNADARAAIDFGSIEDYYEAAGIIEQGIPISSSSIPTAIDRKIPGFPVRMGQLDGKVHSPKVAKVAKFLVGNPSLPVEEEDYYQVCSRAAEIMTAGFTGMIARTGLIDENVARLVASRVSQVVGSVPALACKPFDASSIERELTENVKTACTAEKDRQENHPDPDKRKGWTRRDQRKCEKEKSEKAREAYRKPASQTSPDDIKTAKLWNVTKASSSALLHTWAIVVPQPNTFPAEGTIRGWLMFFQGRSSSVHGMVLGEAEFFFRCLPERSHRSCEEDALWRPWWDAETVHTEKPWKELDVATLVGGWGNNAAGEILSKALKTVLLSNFRGRHRGDPTAFQSGSRVLTFLFDKGNGSSNLTRYVGPNWLQNEATERGTALYSEYRPFVDDLFIH